MHGKEKTESVNQTQYSQQPNQSMKNSVKLWKRKKMEPGIAVGKIKREQNANYIVIKAWLYSVTVTSSLCYKYAIRFHINPKKDMW